MIKTSEFIFIIVTIIHIIYIYDFDNAIIVAHEDDTEVYLRR